MKKVTIVGVVANEETIKNMLKENWTQQITDGLIDKADMMESLIHSLAHDNNQWSNNSDELTDEYAGMLGWDIDNVTKDQWKEWDSLVCEAITEYLIENVKDILKTKNKIAQMLLDNAIGVDMIDNGDFNEMYHEEEWFDEESSYEKFCEERLSIYNMTNVELDEFSDKYEF